MQAAAAERIANRYLIALSDQDGAKLRTLMDLFGTLLKEMAKLEPATLATPDDYGVKVNAAATTRSTFHFVKKYNVGVAFLALLKNYVMPPKERKLLERAARTFAKGSMNRIKLDKAVAAYTKMLGEMRLFDAAAQRVLRDGKLHTDEGAGTTLKAGPFTLVNTGGFDDKTMQRVQGVTEKAAALISRKGFSKICYGDIQVTNTIGRSANVVAFYLIAKDELYVRANLKGTKDLHTVIHELGHRLRFKFVPESAARTLYAAIEDKDTLALMRVKNDPSLQPKKGDTLQDGRTLFTAIKDGVTHTRRGPAVIVESNRGKQFEISLAAWMQTNMPSMGFVSPYAKKNAEENFAEMFAHYVLGSLSPEQTALFESVL